MLNFKTLAAACSVAALALTAAPAAAAPYDAPEAAATATVRLYSAIEIEQVEDLDFGTVIRDSGYTGGSNVAMVAAGTVDCAAVAGLTCTGATSAAAFTIKGDDGSDMSVTFSAVGYNAVTNVMPLLFGTYSVPLTLQFAGMVQDPGLATFSVDGTGAETDIGVYGSLGIPDSVTAPNGVYSSTFTLTADYK
jgi:hypothetical protein